MSQKAREEYEYYFPLYNLHQPLKIVKLGHGALQAFGNLPRQMRREFLLQWDIQQSEINQSVRSKKWFISNMKDCAILSVEVKSRNWTESIDQSARLAKESISILSFLYRAHFSVDEARFLGGERLKGGRRVVTGTVGAHSHDQNRKMLEYKSEYEEEISKLTEIITTPKSEIDRKVRNALLIFEIQTSVTDERLRLVLLTTCMESLLLGKSDRDYLRWRLAEKSAFLFPSNRETIYEKVKEAYDKRSGFVHGSGEKVTKEYTNLIETTVISILKRLVKFKEEGYETMEKVDSYIQKLKFREP